MGKKGYANDLNRKSSKMTNDIEISDIIENPFEYKMRLSQARFSQMGKPEVETTTENLGSTSVSLQEEGWHARDGIFEGTGLIENGRWVHADRSRDRGMKSLCEDDNFTAIVSSLLGENQLEILTKPIDRLESIYCKYGISPGRAELNFANKFEEYSRRTFLGVCIAEIPRNITKITLTQSSSSKCHISFRLDEEIALEEEIPQSQLFEYLLGHIHDMFGGITNGSVQYEVTISRNLTHYALTNNEFIFHEHAINPFEMYVEILIALGAPTVVTTID